MTFGLGRSYLKRIVVSILFVAVATTLTYIFTAVLGDKAKAPLSFFVIAIILAAYFGGLWSGLIATGLSLAVVRLAFGNTSFYYLLIQPNLTAFAIVGLAISLLAGKLQMVNAESARARDELAAANEKLSKSTEALSRSNEELQRFVYALSHDLKSTLGSIGMFTELLMKSGGDKLEGAAAKHAEVVLTGVQRMHTMIDDLLDYARATHEDFRREAIDCNAVVQDVLSDFSELIGEHGTQITVGTLPTIHANPMAINEVFANLIGNAIKYRSDQPSQVSLAARLEENEWIFSVRDNGIGIDMQYADKIFGIFQRLHTQGKYEGSGIGLALCQSVIRRHGGRIWVESALGKGSTFFFSIPNWKASDPIPETLEQTTR